MTKTTPEPSSDEVRELLQEIERSPKFGVVIWNKVVPSSTLAALCNHYLAQAAAPQMTEPPICEVCQKRQSIKTDGQSRWVCEHCALGLPEPYHKEPSPRRNDPCPCGSDKKFKQCCGRQHVPKQRS